MKNAVREYLTRLYEENKEGVIKAYTEYNGMQVVQATYTKGTTVYVDLATNKAYSTYGFLYAVILKDTEYLNKLWEEEQNTIVGKLMDDAFVEKFAQLDDTEDEE